MENNTINSIFPSGNFDSAFNLLDGNKLIYSLLGEEFYSSLYKLLKEGDKPIIENAIKYCDENPNTEIDKIIHIKNNIQGYDTYLITICRHSDKPHYYATLVNLSESKRVFRDLENNITRSHTFLTLSGNVLFEYKKSTNVFNLFWVDFQQIITIAHMDFDKWIKTVTDSKMVEGEELSTFLAMCDSIRNLDNEQSYSFKGSIITNGDRLDSYSIKMISDNYSDQAMVMGIWRIMNEVTGNEIEDFLEDSYIDPLTRILNKKTITEYAQNAILKNIPIGIAIMDIDDFKSINDTYGHMFGDKVIQACADVIKKAIGTQGVAGRIGGDEFMIIFENYQNELNVRNILRCIKTNIGNIYQGKMGNNRLSCSIGVATSECVAMDYKQLFQFADKCLYIAKQKGKNRYIIYTPQKHGNFETSNKSTDIVEMRGEFYSEQDIYKINKLLSKFVVYGTAYLKELLEHSAYTMLFDRITLFWGEPLKCLFVNEAANIYGTVNPAVITNEKLLELMKDDMLPLHNINTVEYSIPEVYQEMKNANIYSSLIHILRDANGKVCGAICGDSCKQFVTFPSVTMHIFENLCEIINAVLIRDNTIF